MIITGIEAAGRKRRIFLNDEAAFSLYPSEISRYHLAEGMELDEALKQEIYSAVLSERAKLRCMHLLQSCDRTEMQLRRKMQTDGYPQEVQDEVIEWLRGYHYVDDRRYARMYLENQSGRKGSALLLAELKEKGISSEIAREELETLREDSEEDETGDAIRYWLKKKQFDPETADKKETDRMMRFLLRKGFTWNEIRRVTDTLSRSL